MKICFLTISMRAGGAERVMSILANEFVREGHEVSFIVSDDAKIMAYKLDERIKVAYVSSICLKRIRRFKKCCKEINGCLKQFHPDIAVMFLQPMILPWLIIRNKIPLVYSERNDPKTNNNGMLDRMLRSIVIKKANGIVFQTRKVQSFFKKSIENKSIVIMNPFDIENLPIQHQMERKKEIVAVGRLNAQKNYPLLLKAFSIVHQRHSNYCLKIYGDGPLKKPLIKIAYDLGISEYVHFQGVSHDVLNEIKDSGIYVLSSEFEGIPNALLEAMSLGLPCVSTNYRPEAVNELIQDRDNGMIVPRDDAVALAEAISEVIEDDKLAKKIGDNARNIINQIKVDRIASEWIGFFNKVVRRELR